MSHASDLQKQIDTHTVHIVLLTMCTFGIYPLLYLYRNTKVIENITQYKVASDGLVIGLAACTGLSSVLLTEYNAASSILNLLITVVSGILYLVWSFSARDAIQKYAHGTLNIDDFKINIIWTLLFSFMYVNYSINKLAEYSEPEVNSDESHENDEKMTLEG
ncbi:DUF4234 domain-containing protein [Vibrio zhugei]|uniref:DUF4234 domain-containing protein n=1 Tax=Vibrio zhugei TaxID=2479546 RepID=A0ABV7CEB3_9VIBR|nr:DUF4234 domain-containing protein [Vibrio zhugei]